MATRGTARLPHLPDRLTGLNPVALFCRRVGNGYYFVRFRSSNGEGKTAVSRIAVRRSGGRFMKLRAFDRRPGCGRLRAFRLSRPVFGGTTRRSLGVSFRLASTGNVRVDLLRAARWFGGSRAATGPAARRRDCVSERRVCAVGTTASVSGSTRLRRSLKRSLHDDCEGLAYTGRRSVPKSLRIPLTVRR